MAYLVSHDAIQFIIFEKFKQSLCNYYPGIVGCVTIREGIRCHIVDDTHMRNFDVLP